MIVISMAVALTLTSCPWGNGTGFDDYVGVNLIAGQSFGAADAQTGAPWFLTPGLTAATADARDDGVTGVNYARWESTSGAGAYAPPTEAPDAAVYRLEVVNLFQNGDFESGLATVGWVDSGINSANATSVTGGAAVAGTQSLQLVFEAPQSRYHTDLANTTTGLKDGFLLDAPYAFHIDFRLDRENVGLELNDGTVASTLQTWSIARPIVNPTALASYPGRDRANPARSDDPNIILRDPSKSALTLLSFGGLNSASQELIGGRFDNIRFVRADQAHYLRLPVPIRAAGRPELSGGGVYTFSLWVKADPAALDTTDPAFGNRFPARHLSAGIDRTPRDVSPRKTVNTQRTALVDLNAEPGSWQQLTWELSGHGIYPPFTAPDEHVVFDIVLEVGDTTSGAPYRDAGSILLAAPALAWQPQ